MWSKYAQKLVLSDRADAMFPSIQALRDHEMLQVPGRGHVALRCFGAGIFMEGVRVHARRERRSFPLKGYIEYTPYITDDFRLAWNEVEEIRWGWHKNAYDELHEFIAPFVFDAFGSMAETRPIDYALLVRCAVAEEIVAFGVDDRGYYREASNDEIRARLENPGLTDRDRALTEVWLAIDELLEANRQGRQLSAGIADAIDYALEEARDRYPLPVEPNGFPMSLSAETADGNFDLASEDVTLEKPAFYSSYPEYVPPDELDRGLGMWL